MSRPKGSKNKPKSVVVEATIDEQIKNAQAEIESLTAALKDKKAELKELEKAKKKADAEAAKKKAEEEKAALLLAIEKSGKSVEEIIEFLK